LTEYYDPKNEPGGEKKLLLAFLLVFIGIAVMQYLMPRRAPQPVQPRPAPEEQQASPTPTPVPPQPSVPTTAKKSGQRAAPSIPTQQASSESETVVENPFYRIVFSNHGAVVKSWILKKYRNETGKPCGAAVWDGCLNLVNPATASLLGYPLSLFSYDKDLEAKVNGGLYVPSAVGSQSAPTSISFDYSDGQTIVHKRFTFDDTSYLVGVETQVSQGGNLVAAFPRWPGGFGDQTSISYYGKSEIIWEQEGKVTRKSPTSGWFLTGKSWVVGGQTINGPFDWVATADAYFAAAFMPDAPRDATLVTLHNQVEIPRNREKPDEAPKDKAAVLGVAVGSLSGVTRTHIFVGPKAVEVLESIQSQPGGPDLRGVVDFGWFGFIARPLFIWLKWTYYHWIPNWGWAIAFLTLVITAALLPLRISGMKSQLKMQKIQPQIKAITEKYKRYSITDPRRAQMQQEMSALYKKEGVNPVGGCFPMLLQLPFLYAFYAMLGNAIELRQARWLWIHDLSAADPWHALPILIMMSTFLSSRSMPQAGMDPTQQKIMQLMTPVMLGLISWNLPAGLGIYWAISNVLLGVQQMVLNRTQFGKQVRKTVEKRAMRKR
jgi:YidC/Oxa1 family membrane protein insertase